MRKDSKKGGERKRGGGGREGGERERERERERQTDRDRQRDRDRQTDRGLGVLWTPFFELLHLHRQDISTIFKQIFTRSFYFVQYLCTKC